MVPCGDGDMVATRCCAVLGVSARGMQRFVRLMINPELAPLMAWRRFSQEWNVPLVTLTALRHIYRCLRHAVSSE